MPAQYKIDKSQKMVFSIGYGIITDQDAFAHQEKLRDDPDFDPSFSQLLDCTSVTTSVNLSTEAIYKLARRNPFGDGSKRALVASKKLLYVSFRLFEILTEEHPDEIVVFRDLTEARKFLKLET